MENYVGLQRASTAKLCANNKAIKLNPLLSINMVMSIINFRSNRYSKTYLKPPLKNRQNKGLKDK